MKESVRDPSDQIFADLVFLQFVLNPMPGLNSNQVQVKQTSYVNCLEPLSCVVRPNVLIELVNKMLKVA